MVVLADQPVEAEPLGDHEHGSGLADVGHVVTDQIELGYRHIAPGEVVILQDLGSPSGSGPGGLGGNRSQGGASHGDLA